MLVKSGSRQTLSKRNDQAVIVEKYTLFCAIIESSISNVRVLPWQMTCHIGAKHMAVTFQIVTEGVRPQFVELFPERECVVVYWYSI